MAQDYDDLLRRYNRLSDVVAKLQEKVNSLQAEVLQLTQENAGLEAREKQSRLNLQNAFNGFNETMQANAAEIEVLRKAIKELRGGD